MKLRIPGQDFTLRAKAVEASGVRHNNSELRFNPRRDIDESDWEVFLHYMEIHSKPMGIDFLSAATCMVRIDPLMRERVHINEDQYRVFLRIALDYKRGHNLRDYLIFAEQLCALFPERRDELGLDEEVFSQNQTFLKHDWGLLANQPIEYGHCSHLIDRMVSAMYLFPREQSRLFRPPEIFDREMQEAEFTFNHGSLDTIFFVAAKLAILYPKRKAELGITPEMIQRRLQELKREFSYLTKGSLIDLSVLACDEVRITEQGIEFLQISELHDLEELPGRSLVV